MKSTKVGQEYPWGGQRVSKAFTVAVEGNRCNLQCSYCYEIKGRPTQDVQSVTLKYPMETMVKAFSPERIGGLAEFTVIGSAETLLVEEVIPFIHGLLHYGHVVTVVTNATLKSRIDELLHAPKADLRNLIVKGSFHYRELKKKKLLGVYFDNLKRAVEVGASAYPCVVISPDYLPELDEISRLFRDNLGIKAHCTPCMDIQGPLDTRFGFDFSPDPDAALLKKLDQLFDTRIFRECLYYKKIDVGTSFCYAGKWLLQVDFATGEYSKCHGPLEKGTCFYDRIDEPFPWEEPVAMSCPIATCALQYNFFTEGLLPDFPSKVTFGKLIYQKGMISEYLRDKLDVRFYGVNERLSPEQELEIALKNKIAEVKELRSEMRGNPFSNPRIHQKMAEGKKIAIYGMGWNYAKYKDTIDFPIACYVNTFSEEGATFAGKKVYRPADLRAKGNEYYIVVSVKDREPLYAALMDAGFSRDEFC